MPTVTGIEEKRGFMEIWADGRALLRLRKAHFAKCPLREGEEFDAEAYVDRVAAVQMADAYEAALTSLDARALSSKQIASSLRRKGYVESVIAAVVERLTENRLIDDARYAQRMAEVQSKKPVGVYAFRRKLRARGISEDDAEEALAAFDDEQQQEAAKAAARNLFRKYEALPRREGRAKLSQALARRGFSWDCIESAIDELFD